MRPLAQFRFWEWVIFYIYIYGYITPCLWWDRQYQLSYRYSTSCLWWDRQYDNWYTWVQHILPVVGQTVSYQNSTSCLWWDRLYHTSTAHLACGGTDCIIPVQHILPVVGQTVSYRYSTSCLWWDHWARTMEGARPPTHHLFLAMEPLVPAALCIYYYYYIPVSGVM